MNIIPVRLPSGDLSSRRDMPELDVRVLTARSKDLTAGTERDREDPAGVSRHRTHLPACDRVPESHGPVIPAGSQDEPVVCEVQRSHALLMARKPQSRAARPDFPQL